MIKVGQLQLYDVKELAEMTKINPQTIRRFLKEGQIKGKKIAGKWYVSEGSLIKYFENDN